jgi:hypothetical protein
MMPDYYLLFVMIWLYVLVIELALVSILVIVYTITIRRRMFVRSRIGKFELDPISRALYIHKAKMPKTKKLKIKVYN